ncbi:helix-turn-helix transcriptional regulator [Terrimonas sp. NA20]|uniref:Helix-turn-helix transcriptional regulator n=1 Tax=Terrimonas ginsenosidimutans TaxID=2908004 RepID=A0ABS9KYH7_9BACT|nr:helix-turn-helix domain-containing protein [Terrimonas ginsenosidimutans]MCG2617429.1 helix-turn-helix transcriptional regulator [Terrimonas ginsenosidimutans]
MSTTTPILEIGKSIANVPFEIHTMEWLEQNRWQQNAIPHRHNYYVVIWVKKGTGVHLIDLDKFELQDNTVYCISPGQVHLLKQNGDAEGYVISFTNDFMGTEESNLELLFSSGLFNTFSQSPVIKVEKDLADELDDTVHRMMKEFANFYILRSEILRGFLKIFLIYLTRQFEKSSQQPAQSKNIDLMRRFLASLEKNYTTKRMVTDYADELVVTPNYLNEVVKKVSGFPASHHIQQRIILEAKRQAAYSGVTMKEVAYHLGFDDMAHFSKFFKNASGLSFTDFKKSLQVA